MGRCVGFLHPFGASGVELFGAMKGGYREATGDFRVRIAGAIARSSRSG
jgi:hypothetical protein